MPNGTDHITYYSTGRPRLAHELCPKKPRANQNRTNQGSILLYTLFLLVTVTLITS